MAPLLLCARGTLYTKLKTSGQLHTHLDDGEEQANALFLRLVEDYSAMLVIFSTKFDDFRTKIRVLHIR